MAGPNHGWAGHTAQDLLRHVISVRPDCGSEREPSDGDARPSRGQARSPPGQAHYSLFRAGASAQRVELFGCAHRDEHGLWLESRLQWRVAINGPSPVRIGQTSGFDLLARGMVRGMNCRQRDWIRVKCHAKVTDVCAGQPCPRWGSNPHWADFKSAASAGWATGASF
jgi:hypothetical protein